MPVKIRPFHVEDTEQVIALWQASGLVVPLNDPRSDIQHKLRFQPELFLVGCDAEGGRLLATVMAGYEGHRGWINYLAVSPERRRQGIGSEMLAAAEARLRGLGCPKINLQVRGTNTAVIAFYRRLGYQEDAVVSMGKRLN
ncbi:MAG: GNAT family acetyltransferase [Desulfobacterales bacterium]|nr:GNAT family acetyltransferase [Desulfobacterales bacterium]